MEHLIRHSSRSSTTLYSLWNIIFDIRRGVVQLCIRVEHLIRHSSRISTTLYLLWNIIFDIRRGVVQLCIRCGISHPTFSRELVQLCIRRGTSHHSTFVERYVPYTWPSSHGTLPFGMSRNISFDIRQRLVLLDIRHGRSHLTFSSRISTTNLYFCCGTSYSTFVED